MTDERYSGMSCDQKGPHDTRIVDLMVKYALQENLTEEEIGVLEEFWERSPEHMKLKEEFGDPEWIRSRLANRKPAPMREMWKVINAYLDEQSASDDRETEEWYDERNPIPFSVRLRIWFGRFMVFLRLRKFEDVFPL